MYTDRRIVFFVFFLIFYLIMQSLGFNLDQSYLILLWIFAILGMSALILLILLLVDKISKYLHEQENPKKAFFKGLLTWTIKILTILIVLVILILLQHYLKIFKILRLGFLWLP